MGSDVFPAPFCSSSYEKIGFVGAGCDHWCEADPGTATVEKVPVGSIRAWSFLGHFSTATVEKVPGVLHQGLVISVDRMQTEPGGHLPCDRDLPD